MMSPLVTLNRSSCVIVHRRKTHAYDPGDTLSEPVEILDLMLRRPLHGAAGLADRRRGLVAADDFIDTVQVFGIVLSLRLRFADESRRHQLMVALAVVNLVGLQLDV